MSGEIQLTGWFVRDKGLYYLGTAAGWWQLADVDPNWAHRELRTESLVRVAGVAEPGYRLRIVSIDRVSAAYLPRVGRPRFIEDPVPQLFAASDMRLTIHTTLRAAGYIEVGLAPAGPDAAIGLLLAGLDRFYAYVPDGAVEDLVVADLTASRAELRANGTALVSALLPAVHCGDWAELTPAAGGDLRFFDPPRDWPASARDLLSGRIAGTGAELAKIPTTSGGTRWAITGGDPLAVDRLLDIADSVAPAAGPAASWCPTWMLGAEADTLQVAAYRLASVRESLLRLHWNHVATVACGLRGPAEAAAR